MSNFKLNNVAMASAYSYVPGKQADSNLALLGAWDMPARIGKTFHDWGYLQGIEPYVLQSEIRYGGRDISLTGWIKGANKGDCLNIAYRLFADIDAFNGLVPLQSDKWGLWLVYVNGEIQTDYIGDGWLKITIPFREPICDLSGTVPVTSAPREYGIDNIPFEDLGFTVLSMQSQFNRPAPKAGNFTAYANEGYRIKPTNSRDIKIKGFIFKPDYNSYKSTISGLYALFSKPGLRKINKPNDLLRDFFIKDGFEISELTVQASGVSAYIDFTITEIGFTQNFYLTDNSYTFITTNSGIRFNTKF